MNKLTTAAILIVLSSSVAFAQNYKNKQNVDDKAEQGQVAENASAQELVYKQIEDGVKKATSVWDKRIVNNNLDTALELYRNAEATAKLTGVNVTEKLDELADKILDGYSTNIKKRTFQVMNENEPYGSLEYVKNQIRKATNIAKELGKDKNFTSSAAMVVGVYINNANRILLQTDIPFGKKIVGAKSQHKQAKSAIEEFGLKDSLYKIKMMEHKIVMLYSEMTTELYKKGKKGLAEMNFNKMQEFIVENNVYK